jgi:hypothetical protein
MAVDTKAFGVSLGINSAICLICFVIFSVLRTAQFTRKYYAPKRCEQLPSLMPNQIEHCAHVNTFVAARYSEDVKHRPKRLPLGYLSWCLPVLNYPEDEWVLSVWLLPVSGIQPLAHVQADTSRWIGCSSVHQDTAVWDEAHALALSVVLRRSAAHQHHGTLQCQCCENSTHSETGVEMATVRFAWQGSYVSELEEKNKTLKRAEQVVYSNIDKLYMTNIRPKSDRLWAHALSVYIVTFIILKVGVLPTSIELQRV